MSHITIPEGYQSLLGLYDTQKAIGLIKTIFQEELCMALHAEQNAIIQAASMGHAIEGGTIYITHQPCGICAKMIVNAGIKRIVVREGYPDDLALEILEEAGLAVEKMSKEAACAGESAPQAQPNDREHQKTMQE